jgi:hypothetical protein
MLKSICLCFAIAAAAPLWSQVEPSATGGGFTLDDTQMMTPPPVSGSAYPVQVGSETRNNYLTLGAVFTASYVDNLLLAGASNPISDETYSLLPTISLNRVTPRQSETLSYSSGFNLYQNTSELNGVSQDGAAEYRIHFSPYAAFVIQDSYRQNSNLFNQTNPFVGTGPSGAPSGSTSAVVIAPFENQLENSSSAGIYYQYGKNAMIGGSGTYKFSQFSTNAQTAGLNNGNTAGASGFFTRRLSRSQYVGAAYEFSKIVTHPIASYTLSHTTYGYYTRYLNENFSLSVMGGPEHATTWSPSEPETGSWTPAVVGSFGWQTPRSNLTASFSHVVSGAGGFIGTYHANTATLSGRRLLSRLWSIGASADYASLKNINPDPAVTAFGSGGHTIDGTAYVQRRISENLNAEGGYAFFHESYPFISSSNYFPNSNRGFVSIEYRIHRPLGR